MVDVQFLGLGDAFGSGGRFQACIALTAGGRRMLLDCGASSLVAMKRFGVGPESVEAVVVSHLHGDHFGGIPFLALDQQFARRERPLVVAGPPGIRERTLAAMEVLFPGSSTVERRFSLDFVELTAREATAVGPTKVTAFEVVHASGAPAFALRIEIAGRVLAYSGDLEWSDALIDASAGADLLISEAYYFEKAVKYHLSFATLREHRAELTCRRIILTHTSADLLAHRSEVDAEVAEDGLEIAL